jgi:hypothetical protein
LETAGAHTVLVDHEDPTGSAGLSPTAEVVPRMARDAAHRGRGRLHLRDRRGRAHTILVTGGVIGRIGDYELDLRSQPSP